MIIDVIVNFVVLFQIQYKIYVFAKSVVAVAILLPKLSCGCCSSFRQILLVAVLPDPFIFQIQIFFGEIPPVIDLCVCKYNRSDSADQ
jgi:hypothetical protein